MKKQIFAILVASLMAGCSTLTVTGSVVTTGEQRPPVSQQEVKVYMAAPANALVLGTVQVVASKKSKNENIETMELVVPELAKQAASIGANGVVPKPKTVDLEAGTETHVADAIYVSK